MKRILLLLSIFIASASAFAYTEIPADSAIVKGVLPNGLTYYIRHNDYIPNRAAFHIAQKVGSIQ
jgi:zinc protease